MIRTQVYLTKNEKSSLEQLCIETGKSQSELIRLAIDNLIKERQVKQSPAFGIWHDNNLDFTVVRSELDR